MMYLLEVVKDNQCYYKFLLSKEKQLEVIPFLKTEFPSIYKEHFPIGFNLPHQVKKLITFLDIDNKTFSFELNQEFEGDTFNLQDLINKITKNQ